MLTRVSFEKKYNSKLMIQSLLKNYSSVDSNSQKKNAKNVYPQHETRKKSLFLVNVNKRIIKQTFYVLTGFSLLSLTPKCMQSFLSAFYTVNCVVQFMLTSKFDELLFECLHAKEFFFGTFTCRSYDSNQHVCRWLWLMIDLFELKRLQRRPTLTDTFQHHYQFFVTQYN